MKIMMGELVEHFNDNHWLTDYTTDPFAWHQSSSCCVEVQLDTCKKKYLIYSWFLFINSLRKEEVNALSGPNEFAEFYSRLRSLKDYHRKYPNEVST